MWFENVFNTEGEREEGIKKGTNLYLENYGKQYKWDENTLEILVSFLPQLEVKVWFCYLEMMEKNAWSNKCIKLKICISCSKNDIGVR